MIARRRFALPLAVCWALAGCQSGEGGTAYFALDRWEPSSGPGHVIIAAQFPDEPTAKAHAEPPPAAQAEGPDTRPGGNGKTLKGLVTALDTAMPLEGALVSTSDGKSALTGPDGRFALSGDLPRDGGLVAAHAGYVSSAVAGLAASDEIALHLRPHETVVTGTTSPGGAAMFLAKGRLADASGNPVEGVSVIIADDRGAYSAPVATDVRGRFSLHVFAERRVLTRATAVAASRDWVGVATGLSVTDGVDIDFTPDSPGADPFVVTACDRSVGTAVDDSLAPTRALADLSLVADDGTALALPDGPDGYRVAALAGGHYALHEEALDSVVSTRSVLHREPVDVGAGTVSGTMLPPPGWRSSPTLTLNEELKWSDVAGAQGYQVSLASQGVGGLLWEGFTAASRLPLSFQAVLPGGRYGVTVAAWDAPGLTVRQIAALAPRRLRLPDIRHDYRYASRQFFVSR